MSDMVKFIGDKMSSRYISEIAGKDHFNVLRDIRDEFDVELDEDDNIVNLEETDSYFELVKYKAGNGEMRPEYLLTERGTLGLLGRYSKPLRRQVEEEWLDFKKAATPSFQIEDPIARAEKWIVEHKQLKLSEQQLELSEQQRVESESRITRLQHNLETKVKPAFRQLTERAEVVENELAKIIAKPKKDDEVQPYEVARALHAISSSGKPHHSMVGDILNRSNIESRSVYDSNIEQWVNGRYRKEVFMRRIEVRSFPDPFASVTFEEYKELGPAVCIVLAWIRIYSYSSKSKTYELRDIKSKRVVYTKLSISNRGFNDAITCLRNHSLIEYRGMKIRALTTGTESSYFSIPKEVLYIKNIKASTKAFIGAVTSFPTITGTNDRGVSFKVVGDRLGLDRYQLRNMKNAATPYLLNSKGTVSVVDDVLITTSKFLSTALGVSKNTIDETLYPQKKVRGEISFRGLSDMVKDIYFKEQPGMIGFSIVDYAINEALLYLTINPTLISGWSPNQISISEWSEQMCKGFNVTSLSGKLKPSVGYLDRISNTMLEDKTDLTKNWYIDVREAVNVSVALLMGGYSVCNYELLTESCEEYRGEYDKATEEYEAALTLSREMNSRPVEFYKAGEVMPFQ